MRSRLPGNFAALLLGAAVGLAACGADEQLGAQRLKLEQEQAAQLAELERIETRLLAAQSARLEWQELKARHGRVSEIACESAARHVAAMERHDHRQEEKRRNLRRRRLAQAQAKAVPGERAGAGISTVSAEHGAASN